MVDLAEPPLKKLKQDFGVKLNDLPELPFEKILGYLSLADRIRLRGVSRKWCQMNSDFEVESLFFSGSPAAYIYAKDRLAEGVFARNFISSPRFESFFSRFATFLSGIKHLRLYDPNVKSRMTFATTLESFTQLETLELIRFFDFDVVYKELKLNLPMLEKLGLEEVRAIKRLTLAAPRLKKIKVVDWESYELLLHLEHGESIETLIASSMKQVELNKLKNLKYLHVGDSGHDSRIDPTFLFALGKLKEMHLEITLDAEELENANRLNYCKYVRELFDQRQRYDRSDLKIYLCGLQLKEPEELKKNSFGFNACTFGYLAENPARLAYEIPICQELDYSAIEQLSPEFAIDVANRFTNLDRITVSEPVQDIDRFLHLLKVSINIVGLEFWCDQPQQLFDRLSEHCAVQHLSLYCAVRDFDFLFRLEGLNCLAIRSPIDTKTIRKVFEELKFISSFGFKLRSRDVLVSIGNPKRIFVWLDGQRTEFIDLNSAIHFLIENDGNQPV